MTTTTTRLDAEQRGRDADPRTRRLPDPARGDDRRGRDRDADGYRMIDTAASYDNEREVGDGIRAR